jgi:hypothetical protein
MNIFLVSFNLSSAIEILSDVLLHMDKDKQKLEPHELREVNRIQEQCIEISELARSILSKLHKISSSAGPS